MISVSMFNNKGGVGKTTLTCNLASYFADEMKLRVLIVDCDPQCNATQLIMGEDFATQFYWKNPGDQAVTTIRDVLAPIEDGDSSISTELKPILGSRNRFGVDLLPGHPGLSVIEDRLGSGWHELLGGDIGGIRKTNWNTALKHVFKNRYDVIFYDLGPSLGSINRCVLIGCDCFLTPMGSDIFSILGIRNIASWIKHWLELYRNSLNLCEQRNPGRLATFQIATDPGIAHGYLGYTMQQYIAKSKEGQRIPTARYENIIKLVPEVVSENLGEYMRTGLTVDQAHLGDVPHLYSLIPLAQSVASPILALKSGDGLVGSQFRQRDEYESIIASVARRIAENLGLEPGASH